MKQFRATVVVMAIFVVPLFAQTKPAPPGCWWNYEIKGPGAGPSLECPSKPSTSTQPSGSSTGGTATDAVSNVLKGMAAAEAEREAREADKQSTETDEETTPSSAP